MTNCKTKKPLAIDLFCGLGGWTEGLLAEGYLSELVEVFHEETIRNFRRVLAPIEDQTCPTCPKKAPQEAER